MKSMLRLFEYLAVRGVAAVFQILPPEFGAWIMRGIARAAFRLDRRHRRRTIEHLRLAYGDAMDEASATELARRVFEHLGGHAADFARAGRDRRRRIRVLHPERLLDALAARGGVVLVSAHFGFFTILGPVLRQLRVPATVILKRQRNDRLFRWFQACIRDWFGVESIVKSDALLKVPDLLRSGRVVLFFADQHPILGGLPVVFFSRPVEAATGPALFARRYRAALLVVTAAVLPDESHEVRFEEPVSTAGTLAAVSQRWLDLLETRIREHPEQWMWMHRRWRNSG